IGDKLVYGFAGPHIRAFGLFRMRAAHKSRGGAWMLPADVALVRCLEVVQTGEDLRAVSERLERLQGGREFKSDTLGGRRPLEHVCSVAEIDGSETRCPLCLRAQGGHHGVEQRQCYGRSHSAKESSARQCCLHDNHLPTS